MDETEKAEKLKNLKDSLAEELGKSPVKDITLRTPGGESDSALKPAEALSATPPPKPENPSPINGENIDSEMSFDGLDKILDENDPSFFDSLNKLEGEIKSEEKNISIQTIALDTNLLIEEGATAVLDEDAPTGFAGRIKKIIWTFLDVVKTVADSGTSSFSRFGKWFSTRSVQQQVNFFIFLGLLATTGYYVRQFSIGNTLLPRSRSLFLRSFESVANKIVEYDTEQPMERFDSPLRHPEHVVLLNKMKVNLKRSPKSSANPMAAFEIYVEASSQEAAIELKDRERQMSDVIARVFETMPYDDIIEPDGKEKLKGVLRRELNQVLNQGRVKRIYFKTLFYKP